MDGLDQEELEIEQRYRRDVFIAVVLCVGGMIWAIGKIISAHHSMLA